MRELLLLLLPIAALSSWYLGRKSAQKTKPIHGVTLPKDYFVGLNYLIDEQPDRAVDVFIKMLAVDSETVETHLALGSLFRSRGEVDRAIRIHQNLIARPQLAKEDRVRALFELGQDYLRAGVLDRAERLFLELVDMGEEKTMSLRCLLNIYEQQKDWRKAIDAAKQLQNIVGKSMYNVIAHYYCELAEKNYQHNDLKSADQYIKQALSIDKNCVRASLLEADLEKRQGNVKSAIRAYKRVVDQDPEYISEIVSPISVCYEQMDSEDQLIKYLRDSLLKYPKLSIALVLSEYLDKREGKKASIDFVTQQAYQKPSLRTLRRLIELYLDTANEQMKEKIYVLRKVTDDLLLDKSMYQCGECGFSGKTLYWQCPSCRRWGSVKPTQGIEE